MSKSDLPSKADRELHEKVILPLATGEYHQAVVILQLTANGAAYVFPCAPTTDDAIDLVLRGHIMLHEQRRQEGESGDDGA